MPLWSTSDFAGWSFLSPSYTDVERVTIPPAQELLDRVNRILDVNTDGAIAFDNGCGTGVMAGILKHYYPNLSLLATDASDGMIELLQEKVKKQGWKNIDARALDARHLKGIADNTFTHTFSTFMVCLAPDPDLIAREMYRVTKPDGILGLSVWADPYFGYFSSPWSKACRQFDEGYQRPMIMETSWTQGERVKDGLAKAGFKDIDVREESVPWRWENVESLAKYFFEGGHPGNVKMLHAFTERGGKIEKVRPEFEEIIREDYGKEGGYVEGAVMACLATARK
ncbi:hypothetical protein MMC28_007720 [Mycoblastus sanguinarius]|nr:hypothetical protein [Mycoblastus sanguinarius]